MKTLEYYIEDFLNQVIEEAVEVKKNAKSEFEQGKLIGYYEVILSALNQAESFGITDKLPEKIREFNPESLLDGS